MKYLKIMTDGFSNVYLIIFLFAGSYFFVSCESDVSYQSMVQEGLNSGVEKDSLFLDYHFGMERQDFRDYSWQLNQEGVLTGFVEINYEIDYLKNSATMKFYPEFRDDKIVRIPVKVGYNAWAPWNEEYWPEELIEDLKDYYESEYETEFTRVYVPELEMQAEVSVDGNREIRIYKISESTVMVDFIDLNNVQTLNSQESE